MTALDICYAVGTHLARQQEIMKPAKVWDPSGFGTHISRYSFHSNTAASPAPGAAGGTSFSRSHCSITPAEMLQPY